MKVKYFDNVHVMAYVRATMFSATRGILATVATWLPNGGCLLQEKLVLQKSFSQNPLHITTKLLECYL